MNKDKKTDRMDIFESIFDENIKILEKRFSNEMSKKTNNKMEEVAKILDKELEEEFEIEGNHNNYRLTTQGLEFYLRVWRLPSSETLTKLLTGELKIKWTPKDMEKVWIVYSDFKRPVNVMFNGDSYHHKLLFKRELITKTEQEAIAKMKERGWWE